MPGRTWFPSGSRLDAMFATSDMALLALGDIILAVAADLRGGSSPQRAGERALERSLHAAESFELTSDGLVLRDSLTFVNEPFPHWLNFQRENGGAVGLEVDPLRVRELRLVVAACASGRCSLAGIREAAEEVAPGLLGSLCDLGILAEGLPPGPLPAARPGITRLQHASLLVSGLEAGVLLDPHLHSVLEPDGLGRTFSLPQLEGLADAVLITHGHRDHWHLPTLMSLPTGMPIVVPRVPAATLLSPGFATILRTLGFTNVVELGWGDPPFVVGDLEIHALPFYGEQPLRFEVPRHPDLRNHGNTYLIRHGAFSAWCLADAGADWQGSTVDVAAEVSARFGPLDVVLSGLGEFRPRTPMYITSGSYWLSLTPEQTRRFPAMADDILTLGPTGVAQVCRQVGARAFLPYAQGWARLDARPPKEATLTARLQGRLSALGAPTRIGRWRMGESWRPGAH